MLKCFRTGVIVLALFGATGAVAAADPVPVEDVTRGPVDTVGCGLEPPKLCLHLSSILAGMSINSVPNMAATAFTREAFVTGRATEKITGDDTSKVKYVRLLLGLQVGCQIDLSQGAQLGLGGTLNLGSTLDNAETGAAPVIDFPPADNVNPNITVYVHPGNLQNVSLIDKTIKSEDGDDLKTITDGDGTIVFNAAVHDWHINVDKCGGPVSIRLVATAWVSTPYSDDNVTAYGDIIQI